MNYSHYPNGLPRRSSNTASPLNGRSPAHNHQHHAQHSQPHPAQYGLQTSSPIPIPGVNLTRPAFPPNMEFFSPAPQANALDARGRRRTRTQSVADPSAHRPNQAPGRTPSSRAYFPLRGPQATDYSSGSNSSSDKSASHSGGSKSSELFDFSPPGSLERMPTLHSSSQAPGPSRFLYTPPQTSQRPLQQAERVRCRACGQRVYSSAFRVHAEVCEERMREAARNGVVSHRPQYGELSFDAHAQESALFDQRPWTRYPHSTLDADWRGMHGGPPVGQSAHALGSTSVETPAVPLSRRRSNSSASPPYPPSPPGYSRPPYSHLP